uniref:Uncharacterized protein n=1 Tax=Lepeophtheirus salmonis TaxID=72036 RepID=A0A0K2VGD6_LEPSM
MTLSILKIILTSQFTMGVFL